MGSGFSCSAPTMAIIPDPEEECIETFTRTGEVRVYCCKSKKKLSNERQRRHSSFF